MSDEMQPGEIARSLGRLERSQHEQNRKLDEIKEQTTKTNGRVDKLEDFVEDFKRGVTTRHDEMKRTTDSPKVITVQIPADALDAKKIAVVISTVLAGLLAAWKAGLFS